MNCSPKHNSLLDAVVQEILDCGHWLHYGRRLLDEDKKASSETKIECISTILISVVLPTLLLIGDKYFENKWVLGAVFLFIAIIALWIFFIYRKNNRFSLSKEDKKLLDVLMPEVEKYHSSLISFLQSIDRRCPISDKKVAHRSNEFSLMKIAQANMRYNLSSLFGKINTDWEQESAKLASEELRPYMPFYEIQNNHE